jgi:hypothetical protein
MQGMLQQDGHTDKPKLSAAKQRSFRFRPGKLPEQALLTIYNP